jgi:hypothetical protein
VGSQVPRIRVVPDGVDHPLWSEVEDFVRRLGVVLDPWQWDVLRVSLMRTRDLARWAAFTVAVCCPRQNGKNAILEIRELVGPVLLGEKLLIHTAHLADTSKEGFRRLDDLIDANAWLSAQVKHIWRTNGHESIEFVNGNRIRFRTRTRGGGRGFSGSPVFFDEPMFLAEISMGSILPVMSAQPDPQAWYTGSAVDQEIHDDGVVFARVRDRAISGDHDRLAYFEWSLDYQTPDEVPAQVLTEPSAAAATNPAYGIRITPDYIAAERDNLDSRTLAVERFGIGDWPSTDGDDSIIPLSVWLPLLDESSRPEDPLVFAFDVTPDRSRASIGVAGRRDDGVFHVEVVDHRKGTGWVAERIAELVSRHEPIAVVCDSVGPAASLVPELEQAGVRVETKSGPEVGQSCAAFFDAAQQDRLRHMGHPELDSAVKGALTRPIGDGAWAWGRKNSKTDISPLVSVTLAFGHLALTASSPELFVAFG